MQKPRTREEWIATVPVGGELSVVTMPPDTGIMDLRRDNRVHVKRDPRCPEPGVTIIRLK
jgi:hypothetical protein